jgi:L-rhamnose mutarotase
MAEAAKVLRFGMVIGLRGECKDSYVELHRGPGIRELLREANIRNFSIFLHRLPDGKLYEFAYYEYAGHNYKADMEKLAASERNKAWLELCDPMQVPLPGGNSWTLMEPIFFNQ